jgi:nitrate reductase cytochrome c-type subunit
VKKVRACILFVLLGLVYVPAIAHADTSSSLRVAQKNAKQSKKDMKQQKKEQKRAMKNWNKQHRAAH